MATAIAPLSSVRTFGVEIECGYAEGSMAIAELLTGSEDKEIRRWGRNVGVDGSGVEIRSPILSGVNGLEQIHKVMSIIKEKGAYVTNRDGMHVHVGAPDFVGDKDAIVRINESYYLNQKAINTLVQSNRTGANAYNPEVSKADIDNFKRQAEGAGIRVVGYRTAINTSNLARNGLKTVEFRQFAGCLDPIAAEAWIRFCLRFTDEVARRKTPIASCAAVDELLRKMRLGEGVKTQLKKRPLPPDGIERVLAARRPALRAQRFWGV